MIYGMIREIAREDGVSVRSIERDLGFANGTLKRWDEHSPSVEKVNQVAGYLKVPIERLIYGRPKGREE